jgi:predicted peptidase
MNMTMTKKNLILPAIACLFCASAMAAGVSVDDFLARDDTNAKGVKMSYRLFVPKNYDAKKKYPLVVFLHGSGERGADNKAQIVRDNGILQWLSPANQAKYPCLLMAPQCTAGDWDAAKRTQIREIIGKLQKEYNLDAQRFYVTGLSLGGGGTWFTIIDNPTFFAAAVPMSGWGNPGAAAKVKDVPVWNFHAADDNVVKVDGSRKMIEALEKAGGKPKYTEYPTGGHGIWSRAYGTDGLLAWLFAQTSVGRVAAK